MENAHTLALFGEAEKGNFRTPHYIKSLSQVMESLGNPPPDSRGVYYAVQAILYNYQLIFFRVEEEGFSYQDYFFGLRTLEREALFSGVEAIFLPGVGDSEIIDAVIPLCLHHQSIYMTSEADLYDYLMLNRARGGEDPRTLGED